jgi:hypothetical protein
MKCKKLIPFSIITFVHTIWIAHLLNVCVVGEGERERRQCCFSAASTWTLSLPPRHVNTHSITRCLVTCVTSKRQKENYKSYSWYHRKKDVNFKLPDNSQIKSQMVTRNDIMVHVMHIVHSSPYWIWHTIKGQVLAHQVAQSCGRDSTVITP